MSAAIESHAADEKPAAQSLQVPGEIPCVGVERGIAYICARARAAVRLHERGA